MATRRTAWLALLLVVVSAVAGYRYYVEARRKAVEQQRAVESAILARARVRAERLRRLQRVPLRPHDDVSVSHGLPPDYPRPPSEWQASEKKTYADLLARGKFDVLIVPTQVQDFALDRPTRSLMTAELSLAIGRALSSPMADPYLVERALGDGARHLDDALPVNALARRIGAKRILWVYVGHDRKNSMTLIIDDLVWTERGFIAPTDRPFEHTYENLGFTDVHPPIEVFEALLPRVLKDLGYPESTAVVPTVASEISANDLPPTPFGLTQGGPQPARDAYYLQLLGALTPRRAERTRERLFEKSLLALQHMSPDSPQYRALKARAYMHLGLRPAALHVLGEAVSAEEKELRAALDGNLPETAALAARQTLPVTRILAALDVNRIAADYSVANEKQSAQAAAALALPGEIWPVVAARAFSDWSIWSQEQNIVLKNMLDKELPVAGYTAEGILRGAAAIGDLGTVQTNVDLSVFEHVHRLFAADPAKWCCTMAVDRPTARDYLDFTEATAIDNLMREANFLTNVQGDAQSGLEFLDRIGSVLRGYPEYALQRAEAEAGMAKRVDSAEREGRLKAAYTQALNAEYWSNGQTRVAADARELISELRRSDYGNADSIYAADYPFRPFFPVWEHGGDMEYLIANSRAALENSASDFYPVRALGSLIGDYQRKPEDVDRIIESIRDRFIGCPDRDAYLAERALAKDDVQSAEAHYRAGIKDAPGQWTAYGALGTLLFHQGKASQAADLFMSYPGFKKDSGEGPVALSNYAFKAGSLFYRSGEFELAMPLYRIAADLRTGSNGSVSSEIRLKLLAGDYTAALAGSLTRARRYNDARAYRDYLGMLHAMGQTDAAWSAFDLLAPQLGAPQLWETALVGQRIERKSETQIAGWAAQDRFRGLGSARSAAAVYLVRAGTTDRMPSAALAQSVAALAWPVWHLPKWHDLVVRELRSGREQRVVGPVPQRQSGSTLPIGVFAAQVKKEPIKSDLVYFVEGYRALRAGKAATAYAILKEAATHYDMAVNDLGYLAPYYAFTAVEAGDASAVEKALDTFTPDQRSFDYFLARGVIAGLAGKSEESVRLLERARFERPSTEERPVYTEYEYAEIVEWLYRATHQTVYRNLALDWARKVATFTPWYAWPYAMQAELETDSALRRHAVAMTAYLDPGSERLAKLPKAEVTEATRAFAGLNPFLHRRGKPQKGSI